MSTARRTEKTKSLKMLMDVTPNFILIIVRPIESWMQMEPIRVIMIKKLEIILAWN
jgi:hypothetical protein